MLDFLKNVFEGKEDEKTLHPEDQTKRVKMATCVLLMEMAHVDDNFAPEESEMIKRIMTDELNLSTAQVREMFELAQKKQSAEVGFWQYANQINTGYSYEEKLKVIELIWKVVYADKVLDKYEDHLVHQMATVLHIKHEDLIEAKLKVKKDLSV